MLAALLASILLLPVSAIWWILGAIAWARRPPRDEAEAARRLGGALVAGWVSLTLLLPGIYAWVWLSRVEWLVF
jgi:hypothetical protein